MVLQQGMKQQRTSSQQELHFKYNFFHSKITFLVKKEGKPAPL